MAGESLESLFLLGTDEILQRFGRKGLYDLIGGNFDGRTGTYLPDRGYQPVTAFWFWPDLIAADQFRDGNVMAGTRLKEVWQRALRALPPAVCLVRSRLDSAAYYP